MPRVTTRPLRDILMDITLRARPVTKALAEEAVRAVAADGVISKDEVDALESYGDGVADAGRQRAHSSTSWKEGTQAGRALFNGLSDAVEALYDSGNFENRQKDPAPSYNPFGWWMGGWAQPNYHSHDQDVAVTPAKLLERTRQEGSGWLHSDFEELLRKYPKATNDRYSMTLHPRRDVEQAYNALKREWMAGHVTNEKDLVADLKPLLERKYR